MDMQYPSLTMEQWADKLASDDYNLVMVGDLRRVEVRLLPKVAVTPPTPAPMPEPSKLERVIKRFIGR